MEINLKNEFVKKIICVFYRNRFLGYSDFRIKKFIKIISISVERGSRILDIGAGGCQYKKYFTQAQYISQDLCIGDKNWDYSQIDVVSDVYNIPLEDKTFDYLLCIEVLEHLAYPHLAFKEFARLLKDNGQLFIVCPLIWGEHQKPYDYFRYTQFALKKLAKDNNLEIIEMEKQGGKFILLTQVVTELFPSFFIERGLIKMGYFFKIILFPFNFFLAFLLFFLDKLDKQKDLALQYEVILKKNKNGE